MSSAATPRTPPSSLPPARSARLPRSIDFVERAVFDFENSLFPHALTMADVDGDGDVELVVASTTGRLAIYKGLAPTPWRTGSLAATVSYVLVGDVMARGKTHVVLFGVEGLCALFDFGRGHVHEPGTHSVAPVFTQQLTGIVNGSTAMLFDVDGDGIQELVVGRTDRTLLAYRWNDGSAAKAGPPASRGAAPMATATVGFVEIGRWPVPGQIGNLSALVAADGTPLLGISQPGGTFMCMAAGASAPVHTTFSSAAADARQQGSVTEMVGCVAHAGQTNLLALATHAGTLELCTASESVWSLQADHQFFSVSKIDLAGDGNEAVVACALDGNTYIVDHAKNVLHFAMDGEVYAFMAGKYATRPGQHEPCLVYATIGGKVFVFHSLDVASIPLQTLLCDSAWPAGRRPPGLSTPAAISRLLYNFR